MPVKGCGRLSALGQLRIFSAPLDRNHADDCAVIEDNQQGGREMRSLGSLTAATLFFVAQAAFAQGVSSDAPGQQPKGTHNSPGASYNTPGHEMQRGAKNPNPGSPGASGYAPGHSTTGSGALKDKDNDTMRSKSK
jgi:hypothetical protein